MINATRFHSVIQFCPHLRVKNLSTTQCFGGQMEDKQQFPPISCQ